MIQLLVALVADGAAFLVTVRLLPGLQFAADQPRFHIAEAGAAVAVLGVASAWLLRRSLPGGPRWRSLGVQAVVAAGVGAAALLLLTFGGGVVGIAFRVGAFPTEITIGSLGWLAAGAIGIAAGPVVIALAEPILARSPDLAVEMRRPGAVVLWIFLLSGAAGLIYEVVWARQLVLVFGNTTEAVSAILTGYFAGLALGSAIGGRLADRTRRPLRMYGVLELLLVVVVLVTPLLFRSLDDLYRPLFGVLSGAPTALQLVRYGLALLALAPATILMGATLPTLSRHLARHRSEFGSSFGRLYAANTVGAIVGTLLAGLILIEVFGLTATLVVGAIGSATAGISAILIDRRTPARPSDGIRTSPAVDPLAGTARPQYRLGLIVAFVSGLTSLGYQLLWTRLLASGSGNTTYVFTLILATFLFGLAAGAAFITRRGARVRSVVATLGAVQVVVAALALMGLVVLSGNTAALPFVVRVVLVVLPTTVVLGLALPLASRVVGVGQDDDRGLGREAGLLLAANTIGAIGGTFVVPFALIPTIGSLRALVLLALTNAVFGLWLLLRGREVPVTRQRWVTVGGIVVLAVAVTTLGLPGDPLLMDPGATHLAQTSVLLASAEDEIAAVQAGGTPGSPQLLVAGTGMTKLSVDTKLMAYLPLMVRPSATRMLVIAFGMGSAYRSGLLSGLSVEGVELVPSVPGMMGWFYPDAAQVLANPRGHITITDGRNFVELSDQHYDLIVVDPPPPIASSGTSVLYSQEFYAASSARLSPGGVMMEWIPYDQKVDEFRAHVQTFRSVFPNVLIAFGPRNGGVYMLGSTGPVTLDPAAIAQVLARPGVLSDLMTTRDNPVGDPADWAARIESLTWISGSQVAAFAGDAPIITDDRPFTEYFLLRHLLGTPSPPMNMVNLKAATPPG